MHRMRCFLARMVLFSVVLVALTNEVPAELIRPRAGRAYPDIVADVHGVQTYTYDPATRTGEFQVTNTPYLMALGPSSASEVNVLPTDDGTRQQIVKLRLDQYGRLVNNPDNTYEVYGRVIVGGQTYDGLLLKGTPTSFGSMNRDVFDLNMKITGGALQPIFGNDAYLRIAPEGQSTFDGSFTKNFSGTEALSNIRGYHAPRPLPVPEPTALLLLLTTGLGWLVLCLWRQRRRPFGVAAPTTGSAAGRGVNSRTT
jgi:hypothetical protein